MPRKYAGPLQRGKKSAMVRKGKPKKKSNAGLNGVEKSQVSKMIRGIREIFYIESTQYALGQVVSDTLHQNALTPEDICQSGNKITMIGLTTADGFNAIGSNLNTNTVHTGGQRLFLTRGVKAYNLNGEPAAKLDGDMGQPKSYLQRLKIHAKSKYLNTEDALQDKLIPMNFRVLVLKVNPKRPSGNLPSFTHVPTNAAGPCLFLNNLNQKKGLDDQICPYEFTNNLRVDTSAFTVYRDIKFKLSNPILVKDGAQTATCSNYQYPATKEIDLWLPQPKKAVKYDPDTYLPTNFDYRYYTFVFCSADSAYASQQVGTTENRWCLECTSISRVQEF
jgi:hypothetical protein